jgi:hypothetical protein
VARLHATPIVVSSGGTASAVLGLELSGQVYDTHFFFGLPTDAYPPFFPNGAVAHEAMLTLNTLFMAHHITGVTDGPTTTSFYFLAVSLNPNGFPVEVNDGFYNLWLNDHESGFPDERTMWLTVQPAAAPESSATLLLALALAGVGACGWWSPGRDVRR